MPPKTVTDAVAPIVEEAIKSGVFPGAVVLLARGGNLLCHAAFGGLTYHETSPVRLSTLYDIASLTKLFTLTVFLSVAREAKVGVETPLKRFFPAFEAAITLRHLMQHTSGLRLAIQDLTEQDAWDWVSTLAGSPGETAPGEAVFYCCTNYFLLARVVEAIAHQSLDRLIEERILQPLAMKSTTFSPGGSALVAPTEENGVAGFWQGVVHDEAARSWRRQTGICAGNAGLFSNATELANFAAVWCNEGAGILDPADVKRAFHDTAPGRDFHRGWGWQMGAAFYMSKFASPITAGHTGFTGPTFVIDPKTAAIVIILNNRVHPTRNGPDRFSVHRCLAAQIFQHLC